MNIGLAGIFPWRPHMEHLVYIGKLLNRSGHKTFYLTCDSKLSNCYNLELKKQGRLYVCSTCILGGIRSYPIKNITAIKKNVDNNLRKFELFDLAKSSSNTITRGESKRDFKSEEVFRIRESLMSGINIMYENTTNWINHNNIEGIITFNGRMDVSKGIIYSCEKNNVPYITLERTREHGLLLKPNENCLGLKEINRLNKIYINKPLKFDQALIAATDLFNRVNGNKLYEWRSFHENDGYIKWPVQNKGLKILFAPSSRNEFEGHPDWKSGFDDYTDAFDIIIDKLNTSSKNCVLRCHPNWSRPVGKKKDSKSLYHYINWAQKRNVYYIHSNEKASTYDLIKQADIIVVNGSSVGTESGFLGKKVICVGHAGYEESKMSINIHNNEQWHLLKNIDNFNKNDIIRNTLRSYYFGSYRFPQYINHVRLKNNLSFDYYEGASAKNIIKMFKTGKVEVYDNDVAQDESEENKIIDIIIKNKFDKLYKKEKQIIVNLSRKNKINRKFIISWLDIIRPFLRRGDE